MIDDQLLRAMVRAVVHEVIDELRAGGELAPLRPPPAAVTSERALSPPTTLHTTGTLIQVLDILATVEPTTLFVGDSRKGPLWTAGEFADFVRESANLYPGPHIWPGAFIEVPCEVDGIGVWTLWPGATLRRMQLRRLGVPFAAFKHLVHTHHCRYLGDGVPETVEILEITEVAGRAALRIRRDDGEEIATIARCTRCWTAEDLRAIEEHLAPDP